MNAEIDATACRRSHSVRRRSISGRGRQGGTVLMPVILMGLIGSLLMSAVIYQSVSVEQASLENLLAETRAYWLTMGHMRYALSRQRHSFYCLTLWNLCDPTNNMTDSDKALALQTYLTEISSLRTMTYPEESGNYFIKISVAGAVDDDPARFAYSGYLMITSSYPTSGVSAIPVLSGSAGRFSPYRMRFCTSLTSAFAACGLVTGNNNGGKGTGFYSVRNLSRLNSAS